MTRRSAIVGPLRQCVRATTTIIDELRTNIRKALSTNRRLDGTFASIQIIRAFRRHPTIG